MVKHYELATIPKKMLVEAFRLTENEAKLIHRYRNQLPVIIDAEGSEGFCIELRELHKQLKVKTKFSTWVVRVLDGFIEDEDFYPFLGKSTGGRPKKGYRATIDTAKQIAMLERTEIGKLVRRYFILCEKLIIRIARREPIRQSCKHSTRLLFDNVSTRVERQKIGKVMAEMNAIVCTVATGHRPSVWKKMVGVENVRDFLEENASVHELARYDDVNKMAATLSCNNQMTKSSIKQMLEGCFGESEIYIKYLNTTNNANFDQ